MNYSLTTHRSANKLVKSSISNLISKIYTINMKKAIMKNWQRKLQISISIFRNNINSNN